MCDAYECYRTLFWLPIERRRKMHELPLLATILDYVISAYCEQNVAQYTQ